MTRADRIRESESLRISMFGTRGVPAAYGGFETAVEEIGWRLVARGHRVVVYCRTSGSDRPSTYRGMKLVHLPALRSKSLETLSHTFLSAIHATAHTKPDVAFVFNAANAPFLPIIGLRNVPVAVHVDGLEWQRGKWGRFGRAYYRVAESLSVRWANALIADAKGIADYYEERFGVGSELLSYGTEAIDRSLASRISELGLEPGCYHLVVARFEPENHVDVIVEGYASSGATLPLVIVGSAPYAASYTAKIMKVADTDPRIRTLGGIWDKELLDQLYGNAYSYIHGHSVGGTNPSLLRAMGAGTATIAWDVNFNREVLGSTARFFSNQLEARRAIEEAEADASWVSESGHALQRRASELYVWDEVAAGYERLAMRLSCR